MTNLGMIQALLKNNVRLYHVQAVRCHHYINATFCQFD
jgi:hypothetical protein